MKTIDKIKEFLEEEGVVLKHLAGQHNQKLHGNRGGATNLRPGQDDQVKIGEHVLHIRSQWQKDAKVAPVFYFNGGKPQNGFIKMERKDAIKWGKMVSRFLKTSSLRDAAYKASVNMFGKEAVDKSIQESRDKFGVG